ncbi:GNAT family N-acetyltransferase [Rubellicoccus peritrichatus]|uniref:GNAT family N-acetyltransferase n=1 Tax=Rubellicoccus peritrichatus TaxID=3080537 RepID=A0AAQ3QUR5_9BACT|nr:GNAT family N-acetyltransferase [Puniceicoccus sp. CR14]WOO40200.1 GNAT family N-acetyltransferase [Puniceicoccus sp. CR14]
MKELTAKDWLSIVRPGSRVFIGSGAACPQALVSRMMKDHHSLCDVEIVHILTLGDCPWVKPEFSENITTNALFLGEQTREAVYENRADYTPCFLSEIPRHFLSGVMPIDVALISVSPPDDKGICSLGVSVDIVLAASRSARTVVAQVNPRMPRTYGKSEISVEAIDYFMENDESIPECPTTEPDEVASQIGRYVAQLVDDGSTLQLGIADITNGICAELRGHKHLGLYTEMLGDGAMHLMKQGVIDNTLCTVHKGKAVASFCFGSSELYDFVDQNSAIEFHPSEVTNSPLLIAQNHKMVSINSALQIDLTGQVAADSFGYRFYSGIGGQVDFIRGAAMGLDGKSIIALPSTANNGTVSRIVAQLDEATGVVTSRGDVQYVVTEFGIASLRARSIRERVLELIQIAHPDFRDDLMKVARERHWVPIYQDYTPPVVTEIEGLESKKIELRGTSYLLRPLHPSDQRKLQDFFYSHSSETIHQRYGYHPGRMTRERAYQLINVDQKRDMAIGIFEWQGARQIIRAVGRYFSDDDPTSAEFAVVVDESKRRIGMGNVLMETLVNFAESQGIQRLWGLVNRDNIGMVELAKKYGASSKVIVGGDAYEVVIQLTDGSR